VGGQPEPVAVDFSWAPELTPAPTAAPVIDTEAAAAAEAPEAGDKDVTRKGKYEVVAGAGSPPPAAGARLAHGGEAVGRSA
jgi:hypothetical protein